ncbi:MAG TPA: adenylate/guanylate cyclase domain-containing protein [Mycobacteriales bacterium]|nr:adenylate/guanylate cyclase domain-containing protein [Mycobacteriales bacterium]
MTDDDAGSAPADERARLAALLRDLGATDDEVAAALATGTVGALAVAVVLRGGRSPVTARAAADAAGLSEAELAEVWRGLGLSTAAELPGGVPPRLAEALPVITLATREWLGPQTGLGLARVIGATTAQLAEAVVDAFRVQWEMPELAGGTSYGDVIASYAELVGASLPALESLVAGTFEAHLVRVAAGAWAPDDENLAARRTLFVAFADLVGYTALTRTMSPGELARMLGAFEEVVAAAVAGHGGRLVKQIGDGAMFVTDSPADGCAAALEICEQVSARDLPPVRIGADVGPVLSRWGDYYGDVVNRAARLVALARPGSVVVTADVAAGLGRDWPVEQLPEQALKGFQAPAVTYRLVAR